MCFGFRAFFFVLNGKKSQKSSFRPGFVGPMGSSVSCLEEEDKKDVTWKQFLEVKMIRKVSRRQDCWSVESGTTTHMQLSECNTGL